MHKYVAVSQRSKANLHLLSSPPSSFNMCLPFVRFSFSSLFPSLLQRGSTDQDDDLEAVGLGLPQQPEFQPQSPIYAQSEKEWAQDLRPSTCPHLAKFEQEEENEALLEAGAERLTHFLMLTEGEKRLYALQYNGRQNDRNFVLCASADLGYQAFASFTLHFLRSSTSLPLWKMPLEELRRPTRNAFFGLQPNIAIALSGVACNVDILPRDLTWDCLTAHMQKMEDVSADLLDRNYERQIATVLENSDSFLAVQVTLSANLMRRVLKYRGWLKDDLQIAIVSVFHE